MDISTKYSEIDVQIEPSQLALCGPIVTVGFGILLQTRRIKHTHQQ